MRRLHGELERLSTGEIVAALLDTPCDRRIVASQILEERDAWDALATPLLVDVLLRTPALGEHCHTSCDWSLLRVGHVVARRTDLEAFDLERLIEALADPAWDPNQMGEQAAVQVLRSCHHEGQLLASAVGSLTSEDAGRRESGHRILWWAVQDGMDATTAAGALVEQAFTHPEERAGVGDMLVRIAIGFGRGRHDVLAMLHARLVDAEPPPAKDDALALLDELCVDWTHLDDEAKAWLDGLDELRQEIEARGR